MHPSPRVLSPSPDAHRFDVLVVGATNVCRSPAAEHLLRARLGDHSGVAVSSVGTDAALGKPVPRPLVELLAAEDLDLEGHTARQLDKDMVRRADLVLTTTRQERTEVVSLVPAALRRTFTLRELARVARVLGPSGIPEGDVPVRLAALIEAAAEHRALPDPLVTDVDDVIDPQGRGKRSYATSFDQVRTAVDGIAETLALAVDVAPQPHAEPVPGAEPQPDTERAPARAVERESGPGAVPAVDDGTERDASPEDDAAPPGETGPDGDVPSEPGAATGRGRGPDAEPAHEGDPAPGPVVRLEPDVPPARRRHRRRNVLLVVLASLLGLVVALTAGAAVVMDRLDARIQRFPDPFVGLPTRPAAAPQTDLAASPVTILVLGSTDDIEDEGPQGWAAAAAVTDVVMLAHVSADRASAQVVMMSPDLAVDVQGTDGGTLRSAFADGGPPRAVEAVEQLTDVRVDHVALSDSASYARVTEALGGVDLDLTSDLVVDGRVAAEAGRRRLTGEQALLWLHGTADDPERADRAQLWFRAILDRLSDADVREDPTRWLQLLSVVSGSVAVDEGFDRGTMLGLLTSLRRLRPGDVGVVQAPTTAEATDADGTPVLVPDAALFAGLMEALRTDTLGEYLDGQNPGG